MRPASLGPQRTPGASAEAADPYALLDAQLDEALGTACGFSGLLAAEPLSVDPEAWSAAEARYAGYRRFQETTRDLFRASLRGDADPEIAALVVGDAPPHFGLDHHRALTDRQAALPIFFRTDEAVPGKACEIQCPGSLWGLHEQLLGLAGQAGPEPPREAMSSAFAAVLRAHTGVEPAIHHYIDGSTNPPGMRFFIQRTRAGGLSYYGYDRDLGPRDCNVVRQHIFAGHLGDKFAPERLARCDAGDLWYDLPPTTLFSQKVPLTFPFWEKTRDSYDDGVRDLLPFASLVTPGGIGTADGGTMSLDDFCALPARLRTFYLKYGGSDVTLASRGKGVFYAKAFSGRKLRAFLQEVLAGWERGRFWICQQAHLPSEEMEFITRAGEVRRARVHAKTGAFYGPAGLMGILRMHRPFYKVHGASDTILSVSL